MNDATYFVMSIFELAADFHHGRSDFVTDILTRKAKQVEARSELSRRQAEKQQTRNTLDRKKLERELKSI